MSSNLPPGVTEADPHLSGAEDEKWEQLVDWLIETELEPEEIKRKLSQMDGWKLVPEEPTDDMCKAGWGPPTPKSIWKIMIKKAPKPEQEDGHD